MATININKKPSLPNPINGLESDIVEEERKGPRKLPMNPSQGQVLGHVKTVS